MRTGNVLAVYGGRCIDRPQTAIHNIATRAFCARITTAISRFAVLFSLLLQFFGSVAPVQASAPAVIVPGQFNVSSSGAFTYSIPIVVPPGTAGMKPAISLDYSSQNASSGLAGWGWTISGLPSIARCPRTIAQDSLHGGIDYDSNDRFCLEGQRLIAINGNDGGNGTEYRTEVDGFSRIVSYGATGTGPTYFKVWTRAGQIMEFGNTPDSRGLLISVNCTYPPQTCQSNDPSTVRVWAVNKISDTAGNYLTVTYDWGSPDTVDGEIFPTEIDYTGNAGANLSPYNSVTFVYKIRNDPIVAYQAGFFTKTRHLLTNIRGNAGAMVSDYQLGYQEAANGAGVDELTSVTLCDQGDKHCLAPSTFSWQGGTVSAPTSYNNTLHGELHMRDNSTLASDFNGDGLTDAAILFQPNGTCPQSNGVQSVNFGSLDGYNFTSSNMQVTFNPETQFDCDSYTNFGQVPFTMLADWDANGLNDVLEREYDDGTSTNNYYVLFNDGQGHFTQLNQPALALGGDTPQVGLFNGTGRSDIYSQAQQIQYTSNGDGTFTQTNRSWMGIDTSNTTTLYTADFDGEGCADLMAQGNQTALFFFCQPVAWRITADGSGWDYYFHNGYKATIADFNGDGKADVLWTNGGGNVRLWLSTATGFVEENLDNTITGSSQTIVTGDWNGDGKADIAVIPTAHSGTMEIWLSTGIGFVDSGIGASVDNPNDRDINAYSQDWNSDGGPDIWVQYADAAEDGTEYLFNFVPRRIYQVSNGIGAATTVTYDRLNSQSGVYTKYTNATYPTQDVIGPTYVVSRVDSSNGVGGNYSSTYGYAGLKADLHGRGVLGFSAMSVTDLQTGIVQTTTYRTDFPYIGKVASQTKVCPRGACASTVTLNQTTNSYTSTGQQSPNGLWWYDVELSETVLNASDADGTMEPTIDTKYSYYDSYGNPKEVWTGTTSPTGTQDVIKITKSSFTNTVNSDDWFIGRLNSSSVQAWYEDPTTGISNITRSSQFGYDPTTNILTQHIAEPTMQNCDGYTQGQACKIETDYTLDGFGHQQTSTVTALSINRETQAHYSTTNGYDGQFATTTTDSLGYSHQLTYDVRFGTVTSDTDPNNVVTTFEVDTFGRPLQERKPDQTYVNYTEIFCKGVNGGTDTTCPSNGAFYVLITTNDTSNSTQIAPSKRIYYDAISREIADDVQGFDGSWIRVDSIYDANGRLYEKSRPYFLGKEGEVYITYSQYDALGRAGKIATPDGGYTTYGYHGLETTVTDYNNHTTTTVKNDLGLPYQVIDAKNQTTTYAYDSEGDVLETIDPLQNMAAYTYDLEGHKLTSSDPDMGNWTYWYDGLGEVVAQLNAWGQYTAINYDNGGRMTERQDGVMTRNWTYDQAPNGIEKLYQAQCSKGTWEGDDACGGAGNGDYTRTYSYTTLGQPYRVDINVGGVDYWAQPTYDPTSEKISQVHHFTGYVSDNGYNITGYLSQITDDSSGTVLWQAQARDEELHLTQALMGSSGLQELLGYDSNSGRIISVCASSDSQLPNCDGNVDNLSYQWYLTGTLQTRSDMLAGSGGMTEYFCYDELNRVTGYAYGGSTCTTGTATSVQFDPTGNITEKTDLCSTTNCYSYNPTQPHAVASITPCSTCSVDGVGNGVTAKFYYDADGNELCVTSKAQCDVSAARSLSYWSFDKVETISQGSTTLSYLYDPENNRVTQTAPEGVTTYLNYPEIGEMSEVFQGGSSTTSRTYLLADGQPAAIRYATGSTITTVYPIYDNLGSISVLAQAGVSQNLRGLAQPIVPRYSYDAWGKSRKPTNWGADPTGCSKGPQPPYTRGFVGQEQLPDGICLINLNARLYDGTIGRFISADPTVESPYDPQDLNRYSYALNDPLTLGDPSGYGGFFNSSLFRELAGLAVLAIAPDVLPLLGAQLGFITTSQTLASVVNSGIAGGMSGAVTTGTLKGTLLGSAQAIAFAGVHLAKVDGLGFPENESTYNAFERASSAVMHGMVGGVFNLGQKGGLGSGFLAGAMSDVASTTDSQELNGIDFAKNATAGGLGSILGGGKFMNGAVTGAFGYLFNDFATSWSKGGALLGGGLGASAAAVGSSGGEAVCAVATSGACAATAPILVPSATIAGGLNGAAAGWWIGHGLGEFADWLTGVVYNTRAGDLPAQGGPPNGSESKDYGDGKGQIRDYGPDGRAVKDYDFGHDHGVGDPHVHDWDWSQSPPRLPARPVGPGD